MYERKVCFSPFYVYFRKIWTLPSDSFLRNTQVCVFNRSSNHFIIISVPSKIHKQAMQCWFMEMTQSHQMNVTPLYHRIQTQSHVPLPKLIVSVMCLNHRKDHHILLMPIRHHKNMAKFLISTVYHEKKH